MSAELHDWNPYALTEHGWTGLMDRRTGTEPSLTPDEASTSTLQTR